MVQRKVSNKLGIQAADHVKSEKLLANLKKPSSYNQSHDGKNNRGVPDMKKKKMKKSRSIKLSDIHTLKHTHTTISPTTPVTTPQKQTLIRSPNYMKSTSSSEARKESSQVRTRPNSIKSVSTTSPSSKSATKTSSLKMVRTLTKSPSFKPVRNSSGKKSSRQRTATCSSTLKDINFPAYLMLNPGATEAEGTSAIKVCPYTYCSLNGHHHSTPLPPLKSFLLARRRLLKTQKSIKMEALSPCRVKPIGDETEANDNKVGVFDSSPISPLLQGGADFFIEIYSKGNEENDESSFGGCFAESLSDGSPRSEVDFEENLEHYSDNMSTGNGVTEGFPEEQKEEDSDLDCSLVVAQNEVVQESCYSGSDSEEEYNACSTEDNDSISDATDMEWEEGQFSTSQLDGEGNYSIKNDNESDLEDEYLSEIKSDDLQGDSMIKSDKIVINCNEEILADEVLEDESACFDTQRDDSDFEMDDARQNLAIVESSQVSEILSHDQQPSIGVMITSAWTEEPIVEPTASAEQIQEKNRVPEAENEVPETVPEFEDGETYYNAEVTDASNDSFQDLDKTDQVVTNEDYKGSQESKASETDQNVAIINFDLEQEIPNNEAGDRKEEKEQAAVIKVSTGIQVAVTTVSIGIQVAVTTVSVGTQFPELSEDFYEVDQDDDQNHQMLDACQLEEGNSSQGITDEMIPAENQETPSEGEYDSIDVAEKQKSSEEDEDKDESMKLNIPSSMDPKEERADSMMHKISLPESSTGEVEKMEVEDDIQSDTTEALLKTGSTTIPEIESTTLLSENESNQELPNTCSNQKWTARAKKPIDDDDEESRKFNPRDPNFLPVVPDPDAEKVDLKHQMMDERRNGEEWMIDFALRQTVTKLAPARKRKVALLVEAFEKVMPIPKFETHRRHSSPAFAPPTPRPIQACS